ncbi:unnamed protein product [Acanthosepion pharaonis]|uniref:Secreted protein n=1 Tax=Acanthosepion pharaonis TaxID=158019 RepID=A0A812ENV8_ACAPH|nr:unnamed protein product [Sepia pharaonis]
MFVVPAVSVSFSLSFLAFCFLWTSAQGLRWAIMCSGDARLPQTTTQGSPCKCLNMGDSTWTFSSFWSPYQTRLLPALCECLSPSLRRSILINRLNTRPGERLHNGRKNIIYFFPVSPWISRIAHHLISVLIESRWSLCFSSPADEKFNYLLLFFFPIKKKQTNILFFHFPSSGHRYIFRLSEFSVFQFTSAFPAVSHP